MSLLLSAGFANDPSSLLMTACAAVRDVLKRYPEATLRDLIERVEEEHGLRLVRATWPAFGKSYGGCKTASLSAL
jgi:hypothetical protein